MLRICARRFVTQSSTPRRRLTRDDVDIIANPSDEYMDEFMKRHGATRPVFKRNDPEMWKRSFGDDYILKFVCLKGKTNVFCSGHTLITRPIDPKINRPFLFMGLGWLNDKYKALGATPFASEQIEMEVESRETNVISHLNHASRRFFHTMFKKPELDDVGSDCSEVGYISYYSKDDVIIPKTLDLTGITVSNASDLPRNAIIDYDQKVHPFHREAYIISHLTDPSGFGKVAVDARGRVIGIGQAIVYPRGDCNLGPMYADDPRVCQAILLHILNDIAKSGRDVTRFEVRSGQKNKDSFRWIEPFLKRPPKRHYVSNLTYRHELPNGIDFERVYCPTHAQLFIV